MKNYEYFKKKTTFQVQMNGFVSAAMSLEMLAYMAELERKIAELELPR